MGYEGVDSRFGELSPDILEIDARRVVVSLVRVWDWRWRGFGGIAQERDSFGNIGARDVVASRAGTDHVHQFLLAHS